MPFSLEEMTSSNYLDFQERSLANAQAPSKERGAMLHGAPYKGLYYGLALSNGNGGANTDDNHGKDVIGRFTADLAPIFGRKNMILHMGVAGSEGSRPAGDVVPNGRTEARGTTFFDPAPFTSRSDLSRRGFEAAVALGPVKLQAESMSSSFAGANAAGVGYTRDLEAWYAS